MSLLSALRARLHRYPSPNDADAVRRMTSEQWRTIAQRTPTYLEGYVDRPGSQDRAQRRAEWIADQVAASDADSVLELGCGCGRNLAAIRRRAEAQEVRHPMLMGLDICPEAIGAAKDAVPLVLCCDVLAVALPRADVILTCGFLGHVPPADLPGLLHRMLSAAQRRIMMVEEPGPDSLSKGPRAWGAAKDTGPYALWLHDFDRVLAALGRQAAHIELPDDLRAPAATEMLVVETSHA